jgi:predicted outer membrane protein
MKRTLVVAAALLVFAAAAAAARADAPPQDENWLTTSISGDRFEIAGGKIALARAETPAARALGRRLMTDHAKSLASAIRVAHMVGVAVPPAATPSEQWELNRLKNIPRSSFDVQYAVLEVKDHNQDIEETGFEAREGEEYVVRHEALEDLPMLNLHLELSKSTVVAAEAAKRQ